MTETALPKRVVVELHPGSDIRAAAAQAAGLARMFDSEIKGVFIEDQALMELAGLPAAIEIGLISRRPRPFDPEAMATEMRRSLSAARRAFAALARDLHREVALEVMRRPEAAPRPAFRPDDLLLVAGSAEQALAAASPTRIAAAKALGIAFPPARAPAWRGAIHAILTSEQARRSAEPLLTRIAAAEHVQLDITVSDQPMAAALAFAELAERHGAAAAHRLPRMIVGETSLLDQSTGRGLRTLMRRVACPVVLLNTQPLAPSQD